MIVGEGWRKELLPPPAHFGGSLAVYYISSFRRLTWPGLGGEGEFLVKQSRSLQRSDLL